MLPRPVDAQAGTVTFGNGVLVVSLPVTDTVRPGRRRLETVGPARGRGGGEHPVRPPAA